jgi:chromosomal replication initiation ATPase DnaA
LPEGVAGALTGWSGGTSCRPARGALTRRGGWVRSGLVHATGQLPLPIFPGPAYAAVDFCEAFSNAEACAWLRRTNDWPDRRLALWGEAGRGKTHLLHIWAARTGAARWSGAVPTRQFEPLPQAGVALDDADRVADEIALLHFLNAAREAGVPVLLAARAAPSRWPVGLPDLISRLRAVVAVELGPPEDALLDALIARLFADRQLRNLEPVQEWLVRHLPRSAAVLREAVARLDAASLERRQRRITVPFAASVLADLLALDEISGTIAPPSRDSPTVF